MKAERKEIAKAVMQAVGFIAWAVAVVAMAVVLMWACDSAGMQM